MCDANMARCKNIERGGVVVEHPSPATFEKKRGKKVPCELCGLRVRKSNLSRHRRTQHPVPRGAPRGASQPCSPELVVSPLRLRLDLQLPAVMRALGDQTTRMLPPTPTTDEETEQTLRALYTPRDVGMSASIVTYRLSRDIAAVAQNPEQSGELTRILGTCGVIAHSEDVFAGLIQQAEARGKNSVLVSKPHSREVGTQVEDYVGQDLFRGSLVLTPLLIDNSTLGSTCGYRMGPRGFSM
jgi:hypothetical protein